MSKAFTTSVLVHVNITILNLNFDCFTYTITEKNEIFLTSTTSNFIWIIMKTVFNLDLRITFFEFLIIIQNKVFIHYLNKNWHHILNIQNGYFSWFGIYNFEEWEAILHKFVSLKLWLDQLVKNFYCCKNIHTKIRKYL